MSHPVRSLWAVAVLALLWTPTGIAGAQPFWIPQGEEGKHAVMFEFLRPSIEDVDRSFLSATYFLSGRVAISPNFHIVGELPYANYKATFEGTDFNGNIITIEESGSTVGNPYLGVEASASGTPIFGELGIRFPVVDEDEPEAALIGYVSDVTRADAAFLPKALFVQGAFNVREVTNSNMEYRVRLSPVLLISTDESFYSDGAELFGVYAWSVGYHGRILRVGTGLSGRLLLTEDFGNLGERSLNQLDLHVDVGSWSVRPGVDLHLPLGSLAEAVPIVLGASVSWSP